MLTDGLDSEMLADLVRVKLAKRYRVTVKGGGRTIRVTYMKIMAAGRTAIEG
jgi:hypothetical protein